MGRQQESQRRLKIFWQWIWDVSGIIWHVRKNKVSICAKDSSGAYHFEMTNELIEVAKEHGIDYAVDIIHLMDPTREQRLDLVRM